VKALNTARGRTEHHDLVANVGVLVTAVCVERAARSVVRLSAVTDVDERGNLLPTGERRLVVVDQYERTLRPELLDEYVASGYCWVVIGSLQAGRSFAQPRIAPNALAYYAALANRSRLVYHTTPFTSGNHSVPFSFDWSIDYYPRQYHRPGPELSIYHLTGGKCL